MKATRRRARRSDPLASAEAVEAVLVSLRTSLPDIIPRSSKNLSSLLNSVRGLYMRQPSESKRGRPTRYTREQLLRVDSQLRELLGRETRLSVRSFVGQYLPILDFPIDIREALERGDVNLFEAHQLARLSAKKLGGTDGEARESDPTETEVVAVGKADELLEADPLDASHLFFEELRMISRALREVGPEEVTDEHLSEIMPAVDQITLTLQKIARRKVREQAKILKI